MILSSFLDNNNAVQQQQHQHSFLVYTFCCDLILIVLDLLHNHSSTLDTSVVCGVPIIAATCSAFPIENDENHLFNVLLSTRRCRSAFIRWSVLLCWLRIEFPILLSIFKQCCLFVVFKFDQRVSSSATIIIEKIRNYCQHHKARDVD